MREYFGTTGYAELTVLAGAARRVKRPTGPKILIVPGMMGSKLSDPAALVWIDPLTIASGQLANLALPSDRAVQPSGILLFSYAKLKLRLQIDGCDAQFHAYDWRLGIEELGAGLAQRIALEKRPVNLIAHSMGGLVARVAARRLPKRCIRKLIMLGTPNHGSFAPVQALRGTYPFVRRMSSLDPNHSADDLAGTVFNTFPGLYEMLPSRRHRDRVDLFNPRSWPKDGVTPRAHLLAKAGAARASLAPPDARMTHIIGINRETVIGVERTAAGFAYRSNLNGDGTVPVVRAQMKRLKAFFIDEVHGNLPNNSRVITALIDLMRRGKTRELARSWQPKRARATTIDDTRLRSFGNGKIDWQRLDSAQREAALAAIDGGRPLPYQV